MKRLALVLLLMSSSAYADGVFSDYQMFRHICSQNPPPKDMLADCLYGFENHTFFDAKDRFAHPRSVEQYRKLVPDNADVYGMCRNAGHINYCLQNLRDINEED